MSLIQKFHQAMSTHGSGVAIIQQGKAIRRQVFVQMVASFAKAMVEMGLKQGQVVGVSLPQTAEHLAVLLALARIGAVSLPIHPMSSGDAKRQLMKRFSATALVTLKAPDPLPPDLGFQILTLQQLQIPAPENGLDFLDYWPSPSSPARIALTSGTTGAPNAVLYSQEHWLSRIEKTSLNFDASTRIIPGNFNLTMGSITALGALLCNGMIVFEIQQSSEGFRQTIDLYGVTHATLMPSAIKDIAALIPDEGCAFPSLKELRFVGGALPDASFKLAYAKFTPHIILPYGISEVGLISVASAAMLKDIPDHVGTCRPGVQIEVVDADGQVLPAGQTGELRVKIPLMPTGYLDNPQRTKEKFRDGWFYTSDMGSISADGLIRLEGRMDDRINLGGVKFFPERVENVLNTHPKILQSAVFTVSDGDKGKKLIAMLVPNKAGDIAKDLQAFCKEKKLGAMTPSLFLYAPKLPRNPSGKLLRKDLPGIFETSMKSMRNKKIS